MLGMNELFVHFEAEEPYCFLLEFDSFERELILDIVEFSLNKYNIFFQKNFSLSETKIYIINSEEEVIEWNGDQLYFKTGEELIINLPSYEDSFIKTSDTILAEKLIEVGQDYEHKNDIPNASIFYLVTSNGIPFFANMIKNTYNPELISLSKQIILTKYPEYYQYYENLLYNPEPDYLEMLNILNELDGYTYFHSKLLYSMVQTINKYQPYLLLRILLKSTFYKYIPIPCENELIYNELKSILNTDIKAAVIREISESFIKYGHINKGLELYYSNKTFQNLSFSNARRYFWIKLLDRDFSKLNSLLIKFYQTNKNITIGSFQLGKLSQLLSNRINKKNYSGKLSDFPQIKTFDPKMKNIFCIIIITLLFLFLSGNYSEFVIASRLIDIIEYQYFIKDYPPIEYQLYFDVLIHFGFPINDRMIDHSILAIGDEQCAETGLMTLIHPIPNLSIWKLRKKKHCFEKTIFWNRVKEANDKSKSICLCLGKSDMLNTIPKQRQKDINNFKFEYFIERIVNLYMDVMNKIHKKYPKLNILVSLIPEENVEGLQLDKSNAFNVQLRKKLTDFVKVF